MTQEIDLTVDTAGAVRMAFLMTHYRSPMDLGTASNASYAKIEEARKVLRRFAMACEPTFDGPPLEILEAVVDDLNTPKAIAIMHRYRKNKQGKKLFAALRFLGFFGGTCLPDTIKTLPDNHVWEGQYIGPEAEASE